MPGNQVRIGVGVKDNATRPIKGIRDAFGALQKDGAKGLAIGAGAAITAKAFSVLDGAISSTIGFVSDSITAASDLNETLSKSRVIFGQGADDIERWGAAAAETFGQSKRQALDTASTFAGLFQTVGLAADDAAENAKRLTELGSDLASFFNTDVQTAIDALRSGLSGETEPLRRFNVFLSETAVTAKLTSMGIKKVGGQFTEAQKATARYALILEQTTTAQGDFARTSDQLANKQRSANAQLEDAQAVLGEKLLPAQLALTEAMIEAIPVIEAVAEAIDAVVEAAEALEPVADVIRRAIDPLGAAKDEAIDAAKATYEAGRGMRYMADAAKDDLVPALDDTAGGMGDAADGAGDLTKKLTPLEAALKDVKTAVDRLNAAWGLFTDAEFEADIKAGELADAVQDLNRLIEDGPQGKEAGDWTIWNGKVAEARQRVFDLEYQMKQNEGPAALQAWLIKVRDGLAASDVKGRALLTTLINLNKYMATVAYMANASKDDLYKPPPPGKPPPPKPPPVGGGTGGSGLTAFATGGQYPGNRPFIAGEEGPEVIVPNGAGGTVIPNRSLGGTTVINLTVQGSLMAKSKEDVVNALLRAAAFARG